MALNKTMTFDLELKPGGIPPIIHASQGDIGRMFKANIYWDGAAATSYISGATVNLRGRKPDKTVFDYSATLAGSMVTFETTEQMTIVSGPVECELVFSQGGDVIASANFVLMVEDSPYNPDAPSESVVPGIEDLIEQTIGGDVSDEVDAWLDAHPEVTTTVQDGAVATEKLSATLKNEIRPLSMFDGATDAAKLYDALITKEFKGTINAGNITIGETLSLPNRNLRGVKIANAIITLSVDMFGQTGSYARLPSFENCRFVGNGHAIYGGSYAVSGVFSNCYFDDCAVINRADGTVQSAYFTDCEVRNNTVTLIKAAHVYDCRISKMLGEAQAATLIDTTSNTTEQSEPRNLWVADSTFESFTAPVFKFTGGNVFLQDCYFEANAAGCMDIAKASGNYDTLTLVISGCKINSPVTPFTISGYTNNYRVKISVHDNYYYTANAGTPMVTGVPTDDPYTFYNNAPSATSDIINGNAQYLYQPEKYNAPGVNTSFLAVNAGGWIQVGRLVFIDFRIKATQTQAGTISNALTGLPRVSIANFGVPILNTDGTDSGKLIYFAGTNATIYGGITADEYYIIRAFYFTDNKTTR